MAHFARALATRSFLLLWLGQAISRFGDGVFFLSLAWWVTEETGSAATMSKVMLFQMVPLAVFLIIGGVIVDRVSRVRIMLLSDLGRGIVSTALVFLIWSGDLNLPALCAGVAIFGFVDAFFLPAYMAEVPNLVPHSDLASANALNSIGRQLGNSIGPTIGSILFAFGGIAMAMGVNAATFFLSALILIQLRKSRTERRISPATLRRKGAVLRDAADGFRYVRETPWLLITIASFAISNPFTVGARIVSLPFLVKDDMGADVAMLGLIYATFPVGAMISSVWLGRMLQFRHRGRTMFLLQILAGLGLLGHGLPVPAPVILAASFVSGLAVEATIIVWLSAVYTTVPADRLGRVMSIDWLASVALTPIGIAVAGLFTEYLGARTTLVIGGGASVLVAVAGLCTPAIRRLD